LRGRGRAGRGLSLQRLRARARARLRSPRGASERNAHARAFRQLAQASARAWPARAPPRRARAIRALTPDQKGGPAAAAHPAATAPKDALAESHADPLLAGGDQALAVVQQLSAV